MRPVLFNILSALPSEDYQYATTVAYHAAAKYLEDHPGQFKRLFGEAGAYAVQAVLALDPTSGGEQAKITESKPEVKS